MNFDSTIEYQRRPMNALGGVVIPVFTPLNKREEIDRESMVRLIDYVIKGGVHGIFVMGTTGEFARLKEKEWIKGVEVAVSHAKGRVPVYVGVGDTGTQRVVSKIKIAEELEADVLVATPPYYFPVNEKEILLFYQQISSVTSLPILAYNIPATTKVNIRPEVVIKMAESGTVAGIKDSSGDFLALKKIIRGVKQNPDFRVFVGDQSLFVRGITAGAHGVVPAMGNVAPKLCVDIYQAIKKGETKKSQLLDKRLQDLTVDIEGSIDSWFGFIVGGKIVLESMGILKSVTTQPSISLDKKIIEKIEQMLPSEVNTPDASPMSKYGRNNKA